MKQRLIGAAVLVALAVIFLPMLVKGPAPDSGVSDLSLDVPARPGSSGMVTRELPLVAPRPRAGEGALGLDARTRAEDAAADGALPMVDTADAPHPDAARLSGDGDTTPASGGATAPVAGSGEPGDAPPSPAEPEAPSPAALPATTASGDYAVRFGSYGSSVNATTVVERLRAEGFPASSAQAEVAGRGVWRVHIGPYASRAQAEAVRVRAARIGTNDARVVALDAAPARPPAGAGQQVVAADRDADAVTAPAVPAAAADVGFVVQLGAFTGRDDANALRERLRGLGFTAFTDTVDTERGVLTRVKAGPVLSREDAERLKAQIRDKAQIDGMVRSHP